MNMVLTALFPFLGGIVSFTAASHVISHYRAGYLAAELRAALAIAIGTLFSSVPYSMVSKYFPDNRMRR